jgi:phosphoenolpyruvate carboxykinase (ATP)
MLDFYSGLRRPATMQNVSARSGADQLNDLGIRNVEVVHWNLGTAQLLEKAVQRREGVLSSGGALVVETGQFTGRSPKDKYVVREPGTESTVDWGAVNQPMQESAFDEILARLVNSWEGSELFVHDCFGGADPQYTLPIRVIAQYAWHSLFARQLCIRIDPLASQEHAPQFTVLFAPSFKTDPENDGTKSQTCIAINFKKRMVIIAGTEYAGELKKSVFTVLNYLLPARGVMPMHCSANADADGRVALFFGLSGTGKTTLSADPARRLIGDDEHGWSDSGVFNFEGGCYAKCIHLSQEKEPQIWNAIRFGTVLENVAIDADRRELDFDSQKLTENTRAAYPIEYIDNAMIPGVGGHPTHILFLTADAFGVLPPISRLTPEQTMYHFLSGYTAKLAGTERGLGSEPQATFSACFGAPFLPRPALEYARMLGERMRKHDVKCFLVNTGWVGGAFGVGERMNLKYTRAMVNAAIAGELDQVATRPHAIFHVAVPTSCPGVPSEILDARGQWKDTGAYDRQAQNLDALFRKNFEKFGDAAQEILGAVHAMR